MKKTNKTKFAILGLLTIEPLSGYEISKLIQSKLSHFWAESNGQIYPTLNDLKKENLIKLINAKQTKKISKTYQITERGQIELNNWLVEKDEKEINRDENILKIFFGKNMTKEACIERLKEKKEKLIQKLEEFKCIYEEIRKMEDSPHFIFWEITLKNGIYSTKADLKWCNESINTLKNI